MKTHLLYCCCRDADKNCYLLCPKGRRINPDHIIRVERWEKVEAWEYVSPKEKK